MGNGGVSFLILIGATVISLVNSYGYKYQYNPASKECQLMLSVPGKRDPISFSGTSTDSRYSSNYGGLGSSSYYNKGQSIANSESSKLAGYDQDIYDIRPVVSAATTNVNNNYYEQSIYDKELEIERERQKELEREREREREKEIQKELEREHEIERERERQKDLEREREIVLERERQKELEREREKELEAERERKRLQVIIRERERNRQKELERERLKELERERQKELERERLKELERERQKELERERLKDLERERERLKDLERERERQKELERERQREREREREYESSSSYEQTKVSNENRYPSGSSTSVSYEEPSYARPSTSNKYNPYEEPDDIGYNRPTSNKNYVEASSSLNANKQAQQQSSQTLQESGYGGNRYAGTSSLSNYDSRLPGALSEESSYSSSKYGNRETSAEDTRYGSSSLCSSGKVYSDALGRCVDKIVTATTSNKKTSSSSTQQASNYNEESTSYGSSAASVPSGGLSSSVSLSSGGSFPSASKFADFDYNEAVLQQHNNFRAKHGVNALVLDDSMSYAAQRHAVRLASGAAFEHSSDAKAGKYGENIALRSGYLSPSAVTNIWYKEHLNYDYSFPELVYTSNKSNVRFTAMVWKSTTKLGVGKAVSAEGKTYVVANYWPPGNYESLLTENIFPPIY